MSSNRSRMKLVIWAVLAFACTQSLWAADGSWTGAVSLWWNNTGSWVDGIVADGADSTGWFTNDISGTSYSIILNPSRTLGHLYFDDAVGQTIWILNPNGDAALTLQTTTGLPSITVNTSADSVSINCALSGSQGFAKLGTGKLVLGTGGKVNSYTGDTVISEGQLWLGAPGAVGVGTVSYGIPDSSVVAFNNAATARLILNGFDGTIGGLSSAGGAGLKITEAAYDNGVNKPATLTLNVAEGLTLNYDGYLRDGASGSCVLTLVKTGAGTQSLSSVAGRVSYSGTTTVSEGTLLINSSANLTGDMTVESGAVIGGTGLVNCSVHFDAGAQFRFDASSTLTVNGEAVTFGGFGVEDVVGLDETVAEGTYELINGTATVDAANLSGSAINIGAGKIAWLEVDGGLNLIVGPQFSATVQMSVSYDNTNVMVSADGLYTSAASNVLQVTDDLVDPVWKDIQPYSSGTDTNSWLIPMTNAAGFFRILSY